jgi:hypothetical protein
MGLVRRFLAVTIGLLVLLAAGAPAAGAHSVAGAGASNYVTTLGSVEPAVPGVELKVIEKGSRLELTNTSGEDVVVSGYSDEPYLRVGPAGVFVNTRSPALYLNTTRLGTSQVPAGADPTAPPVWKRLGDGPVARWHDHRTHWMGGKVPAQVRRQPDRRQVLFPWTVAMQRGDQRLTAQGTLEWVPGPSPAPWVALALGAGVLGAAVGWLAGDGRGRYLLAVAAVLAVLVVADVVHAVGLYPVVAGPWTTKLARTVSSNLFSVAAWVVAAVALVLLARRRPSGRYPALFAALVVGVAGGLFDAAYLGRTTLPYGFEPDLGRAAVALTLGAGLGLAAGLLVALLLPGLALGHHVDWPIGAPAGTASPAVAGPAPPSSAAGAGGLSPGGARERGG